MCGICGIICKDGYSTDYKLELSKMLNKQIHRGPDDSGFYVDKLAYLGFTRLSIIDLSLNGHQPMFDESGRYLILFNGEVFNYVEIRQELIAHGYSFVSNTDTEVVLKAFLHFGEDCLSKFNGMWAFCIYDSFSGVAFFSRDRFGVKPLYYYYDGRLLYFASEINALLEVLKTRLSLNNQAVFDYLAFNRTDQGADTFFNGIKKLPHGHLMILREGMLELKKWYSLSQAVEMSEGFKSSEEYRDLFDSSLKFRLRSDVPVGVCLSGGLDSSSIVASLVHNFGLESIHTFSAVYRSEKTGDESKFIDMFSSILTNMHYTSPSSETLYDDLSKFIVAQGEPVPSTGPYAQFKVMELAAKHVKVTLDGQGADESLAGYRYFYGIKFKELILRKGLGVFFREMNNYLRVHHSSYAILTMLYFFLNDESKKFVRTKKYNYMNNDFMRKFMKSSTISRDLHSPSDLMSSLQNHFEYKLEHLLKWEDRNSMHFSIEARVPFLDYRLVEKTLASDSDMILAGGLTKKILRDAMKNRVPEPIRLRTDKMGFDTPQDKWFNNEKFASLINEIAHAGIVTKDNIIEKQKLLKLFERYKKTGQYSKEIWKTINLELWLRWVKNCS